MFKINLSGTLAACSLLFSACLIAGPRTAHADYIETLELGIHTGYRVDELDWNIAGNLAGTNPNILSELTWDELDIYQVGGTGKLAVGNDYVDFLTYIRGRVDYGWIMDGEVQDSDFLSDDRTNEFSRSISTTDDDNVLDASIGLGFQWKLWQNRLSIAPLGGYSYHEQNLRFTNGVQIIPATGPFAGLNSTYETEWHGPWAGIDIELTPSPRFSLLGSFEYHWAEYEAEADWNLRDDFAHPVSFRHTADDASGVVLKVAAQYLFTGRWALDLSFDYQDWEAEDGIDNTLFADGSSAAQKLNEVNWQSYAVNLGLSYQFY